MLSFFLFFILISFTKHYRIIGICFKNWKLIWKIVVFGSVSIFCRWMTEYDEKENVLYPSEKLILFLLLFDFWGCLNSVRFSGFSIQSECCYGNGKHLQKTMQILTKCVGSSSEQGYHFFICLLGCFWLLLLIADATK